MTKLRHSLKRIAVGSVILIAAVVMTGLLVVRSGWFRERVRERIIAEIQTATGGRVEMGNFSFKWETLTARISPLVLHGAEPPGEQPLLRIESLSVGLRVISALERKVELATLRVERPAVRIVFYPDGSTNLPTPRTPGNASWAQNLVDLAVQRYEVVGGAAVVDLRQIPLNFRGEDLRIAMTYETGGHRYRGELASKHVRVAWSGAAPVEFDTSASFSLAKDQLDFSRLRLATGRSRVDFSGALVDLRYPHGTLNTKAVVAGRDVVPLFSLPVEAAGTATFDGVLQISSMGGFDFALVGRADARGLGFTQDKLKLEGVAGRADLRWTPQLLVLRNLTGSAMGAKITGEARLANAKDFHFDGAFDGLGVLQAVRLFTDRPIVWNGTLAGDVKLDAVIGESRTRVETSATIQPASPGTPLEGQVAITFDQQAGTVELGNSHVATPATTLDVSGMVGRNLSIRGRSTNLDDVLPVLEMLSPSAPKTFHVKLNGGEAVINGTVTGRLEDPHFHGQATLTRANIEGHALDRLSGEFDADRHSISVRRLSLARDTTELDGDAAITGPNGDFSDGMVAATANLRNARLASLAAEFGKSARFTTPSSGIASAAIHVSGTLKHPEAEVALDATNMAIAGETFEHLRASLRYSARSLAFSNGQAEIGSGKLLFSGSFGHAENDWAAGDLEAGVTVEATSLSRIHALAALASGVDARLNGKAAFRSRIDNGGASPLSIVGELTARGISYRGEALGDVTLAAETHGADLLLRASAQIHEAKIDGQGTWRLEGDENGSGSIRISRISVATLHHLVMTGATAEQRAAAPPVEGFLDSAATFTMSLRRPQDFQSELRIATLQLNPKASQTLRLNVQAQDIAIRNTQPIIVSLSLKAARVISARFTARDTNLEMSGVVPFDSKGGADLALNGTVNLAALQLLNADLLARGSAEVAASIRGSVRDPQVNGRMELKGASLYLADFPNGVDSANGVVLFDRNRATVQSLNAETGGGKVAFTGFLEFGQPLVYRLQADVQQVRVRYPEDVSLTANAQLALNGTSEASTLSGTLTLNRAAISAGVDAGRLLALSATPSPAPATGSDYLRGVRLDVHVESSPNFELQTSLTHDVEAAVDLRLRGTPLAPVLLGAVSVNSGEVQIFGNRYTVNRGDIRFVNGVKIEPILDLDLETKTRGITVDVTVQGTPQRLSVNYSSDPPLPSRDIIALLAVGRDPTTATNLAETSSSSSSSAFSDAGGLLGQAVSQELSNRLQRFFGSSRVKIDPTMTGVDNLPEARLTLEQQVSRDVTLTYITNLNRTQEQIVRIEGDLNPRWSAIAVRDANGLFGIDFQYRKRFK